MLVLEQKMDRCQLRSMAESLFGDMVKAVVDVKAGILALDAELHSDLEALLLENGSAQEALWGINLYPDEEGENFIEFDSLINIRPRQNNRGRGVYDEGIRAKIAQIVEEWIDE